MIGILFFIVSCFSTVNYAMNADSLTIKFKNTHIKPGTNLFFIEGVFENPEKIEISFISGHGEEIKTIKFSEVSGFSDFEKGFPIDVSRGKKQIACRFDVKQGFLKKALLEAMKLPSSSGRRRLSDIYMNVVMTDGTKSLTGTIVVPFRRQSKKPKAPPTTSSSQEASSSYASMEGVEPSDQSTTSSSKKGTKEKKSDKQTAKNRLPPVITSIYPQAITMSSIIKNEAKLRLTGVFLDSYKIEIGDRFIEINEVPKKLGTNIGFQTHWELELPEKELSAILKQNVASLPTNSETLEIKLPVVMKNPLNQRIDNIHWLTVVLNK